MIGREGEGDEGGWEREKENRGGNEVGEGGRVEGGKVKKRRGEIGWEEGEERDKVKGDEKRRWDKGRQRLLSISIYPA